MQDKGIVSVYPELTPIGGAGEDASLLGALPGLMSPTKALGLCLQYCPTANGSQN